VADKTRQWFADSNVSYALGVLTLFEYARAHRVRYVFGPLDTASMTDGGLTVSGSEGDLEQAAAVLAAVPGMAEGQPDWPGMDSEWATRQDDAQDWALREAPAGLTAGEEPPETRNDAPSGEEAPPADDPDESAGELPGAGAVDQLPEGG
jgi:hypothetical protein